MILHTVKKDTHCSAGITSLCGGQCDVDGGLPHRSVVGLLSLHECGLLDSNESEGNDYYS